MSSWRSGTKSRRALRRAVLLSRGSHGFQGLRFHLHRFPCAVRSRACALQVGSATSVSTSSARSSRSSSVSSVRSPPSNGWWWSLVLGWCSAARRSIQRWNTSSILQALIIMCSRARRRTALQERCSSSRLHRSSSGASSSSRSCSPLSLEHDHERRTGFQIRFRHAARTT